jgi:hypothetical protein
MNTITARGGTTINLKDLGAVRRKWQNQGRNHMAGRAETAVTLLGARSTVSHSLNRAGELNMRLMGSAT